VPDDDPVPDPAHPEPEVPGGEDPHALRGPGVRLQGREGGAPRGGGDPGRGPGIPPARADDPEVRQPPPDLPVEDGVPGGSLKFFSHSNGHDFELDIQPERDKLLITCNGKQIVLAFDDAKWSIRTAFIGDR